MENNTAQVILVKDIYPGFNDFGYINNSYPSYLTEFEDKLFFSAVDSENGDELWVSDGTTEGTQLLVDLNPGVREGYFGDYPNSSSPSDFTEFEDRLFFNADTNENGDELFVSDGTAEGTQLLVDLDPGSSSSFASGFTEFEDRLFFSADNGDSGNELFVSDGTAEGTQLLVDLYPGVRESYYSDSYVSNSSRPSDLTVFEDKLFFAARNVDSGRELFVSDGTAEGTQLLIDLYPGFSYGSANSSNPSDLTVFKDKLFFAANDEENGRELFVSDGTTEGTQLLIDINPGFDSYGYPNGSSPEELTVFGDELFFSADNGETGRELYKLTFDEDDNPLLTGTDLPDRLTGGDMADQISGLDGNDTLDGGDGNDTLIGGKGADILLGSNGKDNLDGGRGKDSLIGGNGVDILLGGNGKDNLDGGNGDDTLIGGDGNDILLGGNGKDNLDGGNGDDTLIGGDGVDVFILSGKGTDTVVDFQSGSDRLNLAEDLEFHHLSFAGDEITVGEKLLVTLDDINSEHLTVDDFTMI